MSAAIFLGGGYFARGSYDEAMGDKRTRTQALEAADRVLTARRDALVSLALAAENASHRGALLQAAEATAAQAREKAQKRADAIMASARRRGEAAVQAAREEAVRRHEQWREAYRNARDAGWSSAELRSAGQTPPSRTPSRSERPATGELNTTAGSLDSSEPASCVRVELEEPIARKEQGPGAADRERVERSVQAGRADDPASFRSAEVSEGRRNVSA